MKSTRSDFFTPATFRFLRRLARHNDREWFGERKQEYLADVRDPFLRLITAIAEPLSAISPQFVADPKPMGGSLFRIYRDTRFSREKLPYKTWAGARFAHARRREVEDVPVFYLHVQPQHCFLGGGLWHPEQATVKRVREYMLNNPASWTAATRAPAFRKIYEFGGNSLQRPPSGIDPQHPLIDDLKRKDWLVTADLDDDLLLRPDLPRLIERHFRKVAPMIDWLCGALDLEF